MELKLAYKSWSYKEGFKKGISLAQNNHSIYGYFADEENERAVKYFQKQIDDKLDKDGNKLSYQRIEWRKGVVDGINYSYQRFSNPRQAEESPFEKRLRLHDYGEQRPYNGTNYRSERYD